MGRKAEVEGDMKKLIQRLKRLLDQDTPQLEQIVLKYLAFNSMANKDTIEQLLGEEHWKKLQAVFQTILKTNDDLRTKLQMGKAKQDA